MRKRTKIIIGLSGVVLVVAVSLFFFLRYQINKSFPKTLGTIDFPGLHHPVVIARDNYGVPHIAAENEHDLMMVWGFAHAQDRMWQMDLSRRAGMGRLSEIFGNVTVEFDKMFRIIGIRKIAEEVVSFMDSISMARLESYAEGVNIYIALSKGKYPAEFDMLGYEPEPWEPVHSIMIGRLMSWELNMSWWVDLTLGALVGRVGYDRAMELFPPYPGDIDPIVPRKALRAVVSSTNDWMHVSHDYNKMMGARAMASGSNAWVIAPRKSTSGGVILANDTHLQLHAPSKWYEIHLCAGGMNVSGMSVPGIPGVVAGHNDHIAWGVTAVMADDADYYVEELDSNQTSYLYDGKWIPLLFHEEEIPVRSDSSIKITIRSTHHGPIVTDIRTRLKKAEHPFVASMRWTGAESDDQIGAFYAINRASTWDDFVAGVKKFPGPGQNFVYGDKEGNIGYWCGLKLPIRGQGNPTLPLMGWVKQTEWKGFVPFEKLPHLFNPPEGFIATANNKIVDDTYAHHISNLWEPPSRILRLRENLSRDDLFSMDDFAILQNDQYSHQARMTTPLLLQAISQSEIVERERIQEYFENWHFTFTENDIATTIYQEFFRQLLVNTLRDEMGDELFHDFVILVNIPVRIMSKLLDEGTSAWFDDITTQAVEGRDDIVLKSLVQAVENLRKRLGDDLRSWRWGDVHTVTLKHPFGLVPPLGSIFDVGPFRYKGGPTALVSGEFSYNEPFQVTVGASFRQIVDMAHPERVLRILPTGQSGQVLHKNYRDQTQLWLNGGYRTVMVDSSFRSRLEWDQLLLEPKP